MNSTRIIMSHRSRCASMALVAGLIAAGGVSPTQAADINYSGAGGNFNNGPSWVGGVAPGSTDVAIFNTGAPNLNIDFTTNQTLWGIDVIDNGVTFDLQGFNLNLTGNNDLDIGVSGAVNSSATFQSSVPGSFVNARDIDVIAPTGGTAQMIVTGPNITVSNSVSFSTTVGSSTGGASSLDILDQATFTTGIVDFVVNASGTVDVATSASLNVNDDIVINGGSITGLRGTTFNWVSDHTFTVQNGGSAGTFGSGFVSPMNSTWIVTGAGSNVSGSGNTFNLNGASTINVSDGGAWLKSINIDEGSVINVDGAGSTISNFDLEDGTVTIENGATASGFSYDIGDFNSGGGTATLNILTGSTLTATSTSSGLDVSVATTYTDGVINIDGGGSALTTDDAFIGSSSGTTGDINVTNGGTYEATDTTTLNATGTINIDGGTALLGNYNDNGGTLNFVSGTLGFNGNLAIGPSGLVGDNISTGTKSLIIDGIITVNTGSSLTIDGGILSAGSLQNFGNLTYTAGILELTSDNLEVDFGGLLSRTPTIATGQDVRVTNNVNVSSAGLLTIDGGTLTAGTLSNSGIVQMTGLTSLIGDGNVVNNGTISGTGVINAALTNNAGGEVRADAGDMLIFNGAGNTNSGLIDNLHGTVQFNGDLVNGATGVIASGSTLKLLGGLTNTGNVAVSGGTSNVFGDITNNASGNISVTGNSAGSFFGVMVNDGDIFVSGDSRATFLNDVSGSGTFSGTGTVEFANGFSPGSSPAIVSFGGDVELSGGANVIFELGGLAAGSQFDQLDVAGEITLNGILDIDLINAFSPEPGDTFQIINAGSLTGTFSSVLSPALKGGFEFDVIYSPTGVMLQVTGGLAGDLDGDGFVGINDLNIVLANWNQNVPPANPLADPSGDGFVGIDDLNAVLGNWNAGTPPAASSANIPEPGTLGLLVVVGLGFLCRKER